MEVLKEFIINVYGPPSGAKWPVARVGFLKHLVNKQKWKMFDFVEQYQMLEKFKD